ncbi:MAG TPA: AAA family ATPase [Dermatophilaceae bacterium]|nr:AAA family ATPase [Dermatophilaceae bacterium]
MTRVVLGIADQVVAGELRSTLLEVTGVEVLFVADSSQELTRAVLRESPDIVFVHDGLGPEPVLQTIRDLSLRRPATATLLVTSGATAQTAISLMESGGRGVVSYPFVFEEVLSRLSGAVEWSGQMRRLLAGADGNGDGSAMSRARVIGFVGAKGGVGTTTLVTHLAMDVCRQVETLKVCLVDLDLEKGDVTSILEVRHRTSIADVAKVSEDLSGGTVSDAVVVHESGLHLLLAPPDVREAEYVSPESIRAIIALLRREYDLILIDGGAHVTPAQASLVELADEMVVVVTPDVLCLRSMRRAMTAWHALGVRDEEGFHVLVNKVSKQDVFPFSAVEKLTSASVLETVVPSMFRYLEPSLNARDPRVVTETAWWKAIRLIGGELRVVVATGRLAAPAGSTAGDGATTTGDPETRGGKSARRGRGRLVGADRGSIALENVGMLPVVLLICLIVWQLCLTGMTFVWSGLASDAAARKYSMTTNEGEVRAAAAKSLPAGVDSGMTVSYPRSPLADAVEVSLLIPMIVPGWVKLPVKISTAHTVVREP